MASESTTPSEPREVAPKSTGSSRWPLIPTIGYGAAIGFVICIIIIYFVSKQGSRGGGDFLLVLMFPFIIAGAAAVLPVLTGIYNTAFHWDDSNILDWTCVFGTFAVLLMNVPSPLNRCTYYSKYNGTYTNSSGETISVDLGYGCRGTITTPSSVTNVAKVTTDVQDIPNGYVIIGGTADSGTNYIEVTATKSGTLTWNGVTYTKGWW